MSHSIEIPDVTAGSILGPLDDMVGIEPSAADFRRLDFLIMPFPVVGIPVYIARAVINHRNESAAEYVEDIAWNTAILSFIQLGYVGVLFSGPGVF